MRAAVADRETSAVRLLESEGLPAGVRSAGTDGEIAAIDAPLSALEAVRRLAPRIRALGYRYVAIDLSAEQRTRE